MYTEAGKKKTFSNWLISTGIDITKAKYSVTEQTDGIYQDQTARSVQSDLDL